MMRTVLCVWILSATICMGRWHSGTDHDHDSAHPSNTSSLPLFNKANNKFACSLFMKLLAQPESEGKNVFFSPRSVSMALSALATGAKGNTHQQIFSGLFYEKLGLTQKHVDQSFHDSLVFENETSHDVIDEGTAVFVDDNFKVKPEFEESLKKFYFADEFNVDFTKSEEAVNEINKYVNEKTHGKIDQFLTSLNPNTIMYLLSFIYFKGQWKTAFIPENTKEEPFFVNATHQVPVQMMNVIDEFDTHYVDNISTSVLRLPFNDSFSMLLLLPENMAKLEKEALCQHSFTECLQKTTTKKCDVSLPKFSIKTEYKLPAVLSEMGMTDMFGSQANFTGISESENLFVTEVTHKATLDVDEAGATSTAATGVAMGKTIFFPLKFNRPFVVMIYENSSKNLLFMGKIVNPTL
ncbi:alpha-1-antitrypsin-like protein CM55-ST [Thalassophryne amazonica]|uniref:alpha-1-antitrypsin-like protein CM55-ST n=1 Tax=Thalassophryne amazonica TaxID=390379 RepID=UPI0014724BA0|nr:alpha-1-antitrypsin-like protein CM55-ST [Thalassophryne amazonica]